MVGDLVRDKSSYCKRCVTIESPMVGTGSNTSTTSRYLFFVGERRMKLLCLKQRRLPIK